MALRIKSQWFRDGAPRSAAETASVLAFIVWRVTQNMVKQMRDAGFDIPVGAAYFGFMREVLVALALAVDRMAFDRLGPEVREEFTSAMVRRLGDTLEESELEWLGPPPAGQERWADQFIEQCNRLGQEYGEFGHTAEGPNFGFVRLLGSRVEAIMPAKDQRWVMDQLMAIEIPEALAMVKKGFDGALDTTPRPRRRASMAGE